jgi:SNF2 family DNA or RNA helicase
LKIKKLLSKGLVVAPATLIDYWEFELKRWTPQGKFCSVVKIRGTAKKRRETIQSCINRKIVAIISPESFKSDFKYLQDKISWDVMVLDEGHKAKNVATKLRKSLKEFKVES